MANIRPDTQVITPSPADPVTLTDVKSHLRIDDTDKTNDAALTNLIPAAVEMIEKDLGLCMMQRTVETTINALTPVYEHLREGWVTGPDLQRYQGFITLTARPIIDVTSVNYFTNANDDPNLWDAANYKVDKARHYARIRVAPGRSWPQNLRSVDGLRIRYTVGFGDRAADVPASLRVAVMTLVGHLFEYRGDSAQSVAIPSQVSLLTSSYRLSNIA